MFSFLIFSHMKSNDKVYFKLEKRHLRLEDGGRRKAIFYCDSSSTATETEGGGRTEMYGGETHTSYRGRAHVNIAFSGAVRILATSPRHHTQMTEHRFSKLRLTDRELHQFRFVH